MACLRATSTVAGMLALLVGVLEVEHRTLRPIQRSLIVSLESLLDPFQDPAGSVTWATAFNGAMLPTLPVQEVPLMARAGAVPQGLAGVFLRVGPNAVHWPPQKRTHIFDGDGMVYSVRFLDGEATFHCDYIRTPKYLYEQQAGREWTTRLGEFSGVSGLLKMIILHRWKSKYAGLDDYQSMSTANTAIGYTPDGKVWALHQAGPPFRLRVGVSGAVESIGFDLLNGTLRHAMSPHPKFDYHTQETFFHGVDPMTQSLYLGRIADGLLKEQTTLKADPPVGQGFNHDMFITKDYVVAIDGSMRLDIGSILRGSSLWTFDETQKLRFGVYPRAAGKLTADRVTWIEAPFSAEIVHTMFGYNEGDQIILWTCLCHHDSKRSGQGVLGGMGHLYVARLVIDVTARNVSKDSVNGGEDFITEMPRVREDRIGAKARFAYSAMSSPQQDWVDFNFSGLVKWDLEEKRQAGVIQYPVGVIGGEPIFVPRGDIEDDGYVALFLHDTATQNATFVLFNATTFSGTPVVELPVHWRVPLGFHGLWLGEQELERQLAVP